MKEGWWILTKRPSNPMGKLFAIISVIWLVTYLIGLIVINWRQA